MEGYPKNSKAVHSTYQEPSVYHLVHSGQRCFVFLGQRCQPCRVAATLAHLPSSPSCCPWAGRAQSSSSGKRRLLLFKTRVSGPVESVSCVFFLCFFPSEVGSGQPFRESDLESFFVYTLASFDQKQINCSQKATQMEEKWRSGKEFGLVNVSIIEIELIISNNSFWLIWSIYTTKMPL